MPHRRVHFYRAFCGRDENHTPLPFDAQQALSEVGQLDFFDEENGAYFDLADGDLAFCLVDRLEAPQQVRITRSRRSHLPPVERGGELDDLNIPGDAGLAEESFMMFFENNIVGAVYNVAVPIRWTGLN